MTTGQELLKKVVEEFIGCRGVQLEASHLFSTEDGKVALAFSTTLGHSSTTLKPSPLQLLVLMHEPGNLRILEF